MLGRSFQQTFRSQSDVRNLRLLGEHRSDFQPAAPNRWLRELLAINLDTITRDLEFMGRQGQHINSLSQVQSRQLLSNPRFHHWIGSNKSDVLLIDGNSELSRCSPMSSLCAALISGLAHQKRSQIVYFFCGAHCTSSDPIGGPAGLVRCLIAQLLDFREFDIDFIRFSLGSEQLQQNNLTVWCGILRELVTQLSDTVVFCVMDGVSFFEAEPWRSQMQELMRSLTLLAGDGVLGAVFKLLVTSPGASKDAKAVIPPKCFIQILEDGVEDEVVALTDRNMPREIYQTSLPRLMGYSNRFLVHNSDAIEDADNIFEHGCE